MNFLTWLLNENTLDDLYESLTGLTYLAGLKGWEKFVQNAINTISQDPILTKKVSEIASYIHDQTVDIDNLLELDKQGGYIDGFKKIPQFFSVLNKNLPPELKQGTANLLPLIEAAYDKFKQEFVERANFIKHAIEDIADMLDMPKPTEYYQKIDNSLKSRAFWKICIYHIKQIEFYVSDIEQKITDKTFIESRLKSAMHQLPSVYKLGSPYDLTPFFQEAITSLQKEI